MTGWDILDRIISSFPPIVMTLILFAVLTAVVIFIVGFSRHGFNFLKYGFKQMILESSLDKRFDNLDAKFDNLETRIDGLETRIGGVHAELDAIKVNHFGHLKDFLTELTGILLDRGVINNTDKARLDNKLRGM